MTTPDFSIIQALRSLLLDPYPSKEYRAIMTHLHQVKTIVHEVNQVQVCCIADVLEKLNIDPPEKIKYRALPSVDINKMLSEMNISSKFNDLVVHLLRYLLIKLNKCSGDEAGSILEDFEELKACIFTFRDSACWDTSKLDEVISMFLDKLIGMVKDLNADNKDLKLHLFSVMRIMIVEMGEHPVYGAVIARRMSEEIKVYYEKVDPTDTIYRDVYGFEAYFTYLYVLNELVGKDLLTEQNKSLLTGIWQVLNGRPERSRPCPRESYLVQGILSVIQVYLGI